MHDSNCTRRRFLEVSSGAIAVTAVAGTLDGCGGPMNPQVPTDSGFAVADIAVGDLRASTVASLDVIVARDTAGFYAYSDICTHAQCIVPTPIGLSANSVCPCHSSTYNANGDVQSGSVAPRSLDHYTVTFTGTGTTARIIVNPGAIVTDRTLRVPPPA